MFNNHIHMDFQVNTRIRAGKHFNLKGFLEALLELRFINEMQI